MQLYKGFRSIFSLKNHKFYIKNPNIPITVATCTSLKIHVLVKHNLNILRNRTASAVVSGVAKCDVFCNCVGLHIQAQLEVYLQSLSIYTCTSVYLVCRNNTQGLIIGCPLDSCMYMGHPYSLIQLCSDNFLSMAYISVNSLINTLIFLKRHLLRFLSEIFFV